MIIEGDDEMTKCLADGPSEAVLKEKLAGIAKKGKAAKPSSVETQEEDKGSH